MKNIATGSIRTKRILGVIGLAVTLLAAVTATAQQTGRFDEQVREFFFAGFDGNLDALQRGMAIVADTLEAEPDHPQALAWQAAGWHFQSGLAFQRGDAGNGMMLFDRSLAQFERAVSLAPDDLRVLIPRAANFVASAKFVTHAPRRHMMLETAVGDYVRVLALQEDYFEALSVHSRGELLGGTADALWQLGKRDEAQVYLQRMIAELPGSPYAAMAQRQLDGPETTVQLTCFGCHKY